MAEEKQKTEIKKEETKIAEAKEEAKQKVEADKPEKKKEIFGRAKKTEAIVNARDLPVSTKHAIAICNYIRRKDIDKAISMLEEVGKMKKAIPMKGEIPHRKGKIMSGRYPVKAVGEFIRLLKSLKANAIANELELEKYVIFCKANVAARPYRRFGTMKFKRTHVTLKLIEPVKNNNGRKRK